MSAFAARRPRSEAGFGAIAVSAAVVVAAGWAAANSPGAILLALGAGVVAVVAATLGFGRAAWSAAAVAGLAAFGWTPAIATLGPLDLRTVDVLTALLVIRTFSRRRAWTGVVPLQRLAVFIGVMGFSILMVAVRDGSGVSDTAVSWLRLLATASLAWLIPAVIRSKRDLKLVLGAFAVAGVAAVGYAVLTIGSADRASSLAGPNSLGLVAGILVIMARYAPLPNRMVQLGLALAGGTGLLLSKSIGSAAATGAALIVAGVIGSRSRAQAGAVPLRFGGRILVAGVLLVSFVAALRPGDLPGSPGFAQSSTAIRLSVGYAGLRLFAHQPLTGVGWQQSGRPEVLRDPQLLAEVESRFAGIRGYEDLRYGDASLITSVHNMYVQVLAESGIFGFLALLWLLAGIATAVRTLLRRIDDPWLFGVTRFLALALVVVVVWWNDNPLFGGQVESILAFTFLGILGALPRLVAEQKEAGAVATVPGRAPVAR